MVTKVNKVNTSYVNNATAYNKTSNKYNSKVNNAFNKMSLINDKDALYKLGQQVKHPMFGLGVVLNSEESGERTRVQVKFTAPHGVKWLVAKLAKLEIV
jgi:hypothetical protein